MKKIVFALAVVLALPVQAMTFYSNGVWMGTVCRAGYYFTNYPTHMAQPVGSSCPVRDGWGNFVAYGVVTAE